MAYSYDAVGNRLTMTDIRGVTNYTYDPLNRVLSVTTPGGSPIVYAYDGVGNRTVLQYPDGKTADYAYDALNRLAQVTGPTHLLTTYTYDPTGNLTGAANPNATTVALTYDPANRLARLTNKAGTKVLSSFGYTLDAVGNRLQVASPSGTTTYGYDTLYRLTSWTNPAAQLTQYTYDAVGNRLSLVSPAGTTNYSYNNGDEMLTAGTSSFAYDGNGNQLTKTTGSTTVTYAWDALNRLTSVVGGTANTQYQYDGDGNRVSQQLATGTYQYTNDTASALPVVLNENGPDGNIDYLYGLQMISATSSTFQDYYQFDGLGSTSVLTGSTGASKETYTYDPWGTVLNTTDPLGTKNKYKFTGQAFDANSGLFFLRARYYDPTIGRFLSRDSLGGGVTAPTAQNRYLYAADRPTSQVDPSGLSPEFSSTQGPVLNGSSPCFQRGALNVSQISCLLGSAAVSGQLTDYLQGSSGAASGVAGVASAAVGAYQDANNPNLNAGLKIGRTSANILLGVNPIVGIPYGAASILWPSQTDAALNWTLNTMGDLGANAIGGVTFLTGTSAAFQSWASSPSWADY